VANDQNSLGVVVSRGPWLSELGKIDITSTVPEVTVNQVTFNEGCETTTEFPVTLKVKETLKVEGKRGCSISTHTVEVTTSTGKQKFINPIQGSRAFTYVGPFDPH
jgi:hypothetical protein